VLIGSDGPKQKNEPTMVMGVRGLVGVELVADNGRPASLHSGNYGNIVPNPVLPLARLIEDIESRVRAFGDTHDTFGARPPSCSPSGRTRRSGSRSCARR
jgi:hypothetical protein